MATLFKKKRKLGMATHEENTNPTLPIDLISEIFSRLPAESLSELLQDDCESCWDSLISSPEFVKTHLSKSTNDPSLAHHRLLLITWDYEEQANIPYMKLSSCSVSSLLNDHETVPDPIKTCHLPPEVDNIDVVGFCNGLFCLSSRLKSGEDIFLWNPFTGTYRILPTNEHEHGARGFCYDESNDDYKVFATLHQNVSVYSSKSGCWRIIGDYRSGEICGLGSFAKGAVHWLVERNNMQSKHRKSEIIVSLDINNETYGEVPLPPKGEDGGSWTTTLDTFGESLSVLYTFKTRADFWVMKEYGVEESWTKLFTIPLPCDSWIELLCISIGGDIMLLSGSAIVLYNPKSNTFKKLLDMPDTEFDVGALYAYTYVESLVSPPN